MKSLLIYLKDYKKESILAPLFKMLEAIFELFVPIVMAIIIDKGIANADKNYVIKMCLLLLMLAVIGLICSISAQYFAAKAAVGFSTKLREGLFDHIQKLSFSEMDTIGTSTLITRMTSDINQVQSGVNLVLRLFLRSPFIVFGAMIMAFTIHVKAAFIFVVTIPLLSIVVFGIMIITMPLYKNVQTSLDKVLQITRQNLTGTRVIRAFGSEENEIDNFIVNNRQLTNIQKYVGKISGLMNPITYVIINGAIVILIWNGAFQVNTGEISQGQLIALVNYMSQILVELIKLANLIITVTKALACAKRIENIFGIKSSMKVIDKATEDVWNSQETRKHNTCEQIPEVEFHHACLAYKNAGEESLTDIHFKAYKGQIIGIIGGTGSGKSSLVNLIPRFYDATKGDVFIQGKNVKELTLEQLRDKIGVVMQQAVLFKGSIKENLLWGKEDATTEEIESALSISQAKEFVEQYENGIHHAIDQGGKNLSGGQRQRLTIARAIIKRPQILILDDSSSALDFATDAKLRMSLEHLDYKPTVFIVSQRVTSIQNADQILVLEDGNMVGMGTHEELLLNCPVYKEIYNSQIH